MSLSYWVRISSHAVYLTQLETKIERQRSQSTNIRNNFVALLLSWAVTNCLLWVFPLSVPANYVANKYKSDLFAVRAHYRCMGCFKWSYSKKILQGISLFFRISVLLLYWSPGQLFSTAIITCICFLFIVLNREWRIERFWLLNVERRSSYFYFDFPPMLTTQYLFSTSYKKSYLWF